MISVCLTYFLIWCVFWSFSEKHLAIKLLFKWFLFLKIWIWVLINGIIKIEVLLIEIYFRKLNFCVILTLLERKLVLFDGIRELLQQLIFIFLMGRRTKTLSSSWVSSWFLFCIELWALFFCTWFIIFKEPFLYCLIMNILRIVFIFLIGDLCFSDVIVVKFFNNIIVDFLLVRWLFLVH